MMDAWDVTHATADVVVGVDEDDSQLQEYVRVVDHPRFGLEVGPRRGLAGTTNELARMYVDDYRFLGSIGDDHVPRTPEWDKTIEAELERLGTGIVYPNDLLQGERLPTAAFLTSDIVKRLGWMALPTAKHMFIDNAWKALGEKLGALSYLPDVIVEHCHFVAGKAEADEVYSQGNASWVTDEAAFRDWLEHQIDSDVAAIRA